MADLFDDILLRVGVEWESAGGELVADWRGRISEPGPPASEPGNYPHKRTGNLAAGTFSRVDVDPSRVALSLGNSATYYQYLRDGTGRMRPRLMLDGLVDDWLPRLIRRATEAAHKTS